MYRHAVASLFALVFLLPSAAVAYYEHPSDLLQAMEFDGSTPRSFSLESYMRLGDTHFQATVDGTAAGSSPLNLQGKFIASITIEENGVTFYSKYELLMHQQVIYIRLLETYGNSPAEFSLPASQQLLGQWIAIPMEPNSMNVLRYRGEGRDIEPELAYTTDVFASPEEIHRIGQEVTDAILSLQRTAFEGGQAYSLKLHPNSLPRLLQVLDLIAQQYGQSDGFSTYLNDPALNDMFNESVNLHIKIDTDETGRFQFGKFYVSVTGGDFFVALNGSTHVTDQSATVRTPSQFISLPELYTMINQMNTSQFDWLFDDEWGSEGWTPGAGGATVDWELPPSDWEEMPAVPPQFLPPTHQTRSTRPVRQPRRVRWQDVRATSGDCQAQPGSPAYLQLVRKGLCPAFNDSRPGRGSLRDQR